MVGWGQGLPHCRVQGPVPWDGTGSQPSPAAFCRAQPYAMIWGWGQALSCCVRGGPSGRRALLLGSGEQLLELLTPPKARETKMRQVFTTLGHKAWPFTQLSVIFSFPINPGKSLWSLSTQVPCRGSVSPKPPQDTKRRGREPRAVLLVCEQPSGGSHSSPVKQITLPRLRVLVGIRGFSPINVLFFGRATVSKHGAGSRLRGLLCG